MPNPANISTSGNMQEVHLGTGVVQRAGVDLGYLKGDCKWEYTPTILDFMQGTPEVLIGSGMTELKNELEVPVAQFNPTNVAIALGGYTIQQNVGDPTTVADELLTFATYLGGSLQYIPLDGPNATSVVVKNTAGSSTYTVNTDYFVDAVNGKIFRNPGGSISSGQQVKVSYSYTIPDSSQLNLGSQFSLEATDLTFIHSNATGIVAGKSTVTIHMWKARCLGKISVDFKSKDWVINQLRFSAIYDATHSDNPMGYVQWS